MHAAVGKIGAAEIFPPVRASINAVGGAGKNESRIARVHEDGEDLKLAQRVFPVAPLPGATKHAGKTGLLVGVITPDPSEHIG